MTGGAVAGGVAERAEASRQKAAVDADPVDALRRLDVRDVPFRVMADGSRWEPLQALRPGGVPLRPSDFSVAAVHDLSRDRMCLTWRREFREPLTAVVEYDEIIVGNAGYISGADVALHPQPARAMTSERLAAVRRQQYLLHPHLLVSEACRRQDETGQHLFRWAKDQTLDGVSHRVIEIDFAPRPVLIFVSTQTGLISRLTTQENDFPCGDVDIVVSFADWRGFDSQDFPFQVDLSWDGIVLHREIRTAVDLGMAVDDARFALPETLPFDPEHARHGITSSQWMHRCLAMGAPIAIEAGEVAVQSITPRVVTLGGGIHHSLAIALAEGIVVVDPPQHEARSLAVIAALRATWPDKPISHLVLTHHHYDHSGGIRAYAAIGAHLIVAEGDLAFVRRCLERPHSIEPDLLSRTTVTPQITVVGDEPLRLGDGVLSVHRISSPHCAEDLLVYVAEPKLLFNADLFNPGLVPHGAAPPPYWLTYSRDFRRKVEGLGLEIDLLIGAHGTLDGRPYQDLVDFTQDSRDDHP